MDNLEKGSWIINTIKHTTGVRTDTVELNDLEVTERAGKSGILLGKLLVDKQEKMCIRDRLSAELPHAS